MNKQSTYWLPVHWLNNANKVKLLSTSFQKKRVKKNLKLVMLMENHTSFLTRNLALSTQIFITSIKRNFWVIVRLNDMFTIICEQSCVSWDLLRVNNLYKNICDLFYCYVKFVCIFFSYFNKFWNERESNSMMIRETIRTHFSYSCVYF